MHYFFMTYKGSSCCDLRGISACIAVLVLLATLGVSIYTLNEVKALKSAVVPKTISLDQFLQKLTAHAELKSYANIPPLNVIRIDNTNLGNLQAQINGLDTSYIGKYIVEYTNRMVIYDFDNDKIAGSVTQQTAQTAQLPQDFSSKLLSHPELKGAENANPSGGILDQQSLDTLRQNFPDVYKNAKAGNYLLRYSDRLIIYDYQNDVIVGAFALR